jgi:hypothetical protein
MASFWAPFKTKRYWRQYTIALAFVTVAVVFIIILVKNTSLANAIVAFGTLILALITTISIINANDQAKRDRKERWINEIVEWAIQVINWRSANKGIFRGITGAKSPKGQRLRKYAHIIELEETLAGMRGRNQYAEKITLKLSPNLHDAVEKLIKGVEDYAKILADWQQAIDSDIALADDKSSAEKASVAERQVGELADKVIEEATKLKTRDIS